METKAIVPEPASKPFWKSLTFFGGLLTFIGGGLSALGYNEIGTTLLGFGAGLGFVGLRQAKESIRWSFN